MSNETGWLRYLGLGVYAGLVAIGVVTGIINNAVEYATALAPIIVFIGADQVKHRED